MDGRFFESSIDSFCVFFGYEHETKFHIIYIVLYRGKKHFIRSKNFLMLSWYEILHSSLSMKMLDGSEFITRLLRDGQDTHCNYNYAIVRRFKNKAWILRGNESSEIKLLQWKLTAVSFREKNWFSSDKHFFSNFTGISVY